MKECMLGQLNSNGRIKYIALKLEDATVSRRWGLVGGKAQHTSNTYDYINKGKSNELSPEQAAEEDYERIIKTKTKEGYTIADSLDEFSDVADDVMDFDNVPTSFCCSKPKTSISDKALQKLIDDGNAIIDVKENGLCHYVVIDNLSRVKIYTRRMDDHTAKYPMLVNEIKAMKLPTQTILAVELVIDPLEGLPHMEAFQLIQGISKSDTVRGQLKDDLTRTRELQSKNKVRAMVFNIVYLGSGDTSKSSYGVIRKYIDETFASVYGGNLFYAPMDRTERFKTASEVRTWVNDFFMDCEGVIVWDKTECIEISFNGKPKRRACYKVKPVKDDDVVAYGWNEGTGKKQGKIGSLKIGKYEEDGNLFDMGNVGSGLDDSDLDPNDWEFPCVVEITYDQRFPTKKYQFPRFSKKHEDKIPSDIVVDEDGF